ncbi:2,3-diaminopropionate biosynthesis protein SbnB [Agrobacterium vitis]|uniref:2,3-diaminopropionate biosynthesis protein SbnB n=1 Tax=Agrobacterium vitis TaxID=373 RepID=UPI0018D1FA84|nr:2,3-diaminopropionate biosynthesis protein SbnB [Agrobacterium vitis]
MTNKLEPPPFHVIPGSIVNALLTELQPELTSIVEQAYLAHDAGQTVNPDSYFLRFPKEEANRIIALPAAVTDSDFSPAVTGIKWIASYPDNIKAGIPRASAVLVLNDQRSGYPYAILEAAKISSQRTAASAALGAFWLNGQSKRAGSISFVGAGVISRNIFQLLQSEHWDLGQVYVHDTDPLSAKAFAEYAIEQHKVRVEEVALEGALGTDIVVFTTNAGTPYVIDPSVFTAGQIVLNISLRDLSPEIIKSSYNIFDDVNHCLKANTSPHLAVQKYPGKEFLSGTLAEVIRKTIHLPRDKPIIFSPFGLGILDLAVGYQVYSMAVKRDLAIQIPGFFAEEKRW